MIYFTKEFNKKLIDKDLNRKKLSALIGINPNTLAVKLDNINAEFKLSEALKIAKVLNLSDEEFLMIFFNK